MNSDNEKGKKIKISKEKNNQAKKKKSRITENVSLIGGSLNIKFDEFNFNKKFLKEIKNLEQFLLDEPPQPSKFYLKLLNLYKLNGNDIKLLKYYFNELEKGLDFNLSQDGKLSLIRCLKNLSNADLNIYQERLTLIEKGILHSDVTVGELFKSIHEQIHDKDCKFFVEHFPYLEKITGSQDFRFFSDFKKIYFFILSEEKDFLKDQKDFLKKYLYITFEDVAIENNNQNKAKFLNEIRDTLMLKLSDIFLTTSSLSKEIFTQIINDYIATNPVDESKKLYYEEQFLVLIDQYFQNHFEIFLDSSFITKCYLTNDSLRIIVSKNFLVYTRNEPSIFKLYSDLILSRINNVLNESEIDEEIQNLMSIIQHVVLENEEFFEENLTFFMSLIFSEQEIIRKYAIQTLHSVFSKFIYKIYYIEGILDTYLSNEDEEIRSIAIEVFNLIYYFYLNEDDEENRVIILEFLIPFLTRNYLFLDISTIVSKILYTVITNYPKKLSRFFDDIVLLIDSIKDPLIKINYNEIKIKIVSQSLKLFVS